MKKANIVVSLLGMALSGYVIYTASGFPENMSATDPGAAFFPTLMGFFMAALCLALLVTSLMGKGADIDVQLTITPGMKRAFVGIGMFAVYCLLFKRLGFILDTIWFCFAGMFLLRNRKYIAMTIISIAVAVVIYVIFARFLGAKLPAGVLKGLL